MESIADDKYEVIGRSNSFTPTPPIKHNQEKSKLKLIEHTGNGLSQPVEPYIRIADDSVESPKMSSFKPKHENINLTPPIPDVSTPDKTDAPVKNNTHSE